LTKKYLETNQSKLELLFANEIQKCVILLLMDEFDNNDEIDLFDAEMINCFGDEQHNLYDECLNDLKSKINAHLKVKSTHFRNKNKYLINKFKLTKNMNKMIDHPLRGKYRKLKKIGQGSEAVVYKIEDILDGQFK
jgi:hypothetical protein